MADGYLYYGRTVYHKARAMSKVVRESFAPALSLFDKTHYNRDS
jgi:hypothetical protein